MSKFKKGDRVVLNESTEHNKRWSKGEVVEVGALVPDFIRVQFDGFDYTLWTRENILEMDNGINTSVLDSYTIPEIIAHFGWENIIDQIGEDKAKEYFHLIKRH